MCFQHYGPLTIDWPHKVHSKSTIPPKGEFYFQAQEKNDHIETLEAIS